MMVQKRENRISGFQAMLLAISSVVLGFCFVLLSVYFPEIGSDSFFTRLMALIIVSPLSIAIFIGFPITVSIRMEIGKPSFIIITIIFGLISFLFLYYFVHNKPILFDLIDRKLTVSFILIIPFLCFSFVFLVLSNTVFFGGVNKVIKTSNRKTFKLILNCLFFILVYSRITFLMACTYLLQTLLMSFRCFLLETIIRID